MFPSPSGNIDGEDNDNAVIVNTELTVEEEGVMEIDE